MGISAAEPLYDRATALYEGLAHEFPDTPVHVQRVSETLRDKAKVQSNLGRLKDAALTLERALEVSRKLDGKPARIRTGRLLIGCTRQLRSQRALPRLAKPAV